MKKLTFAVKTFFMLIVFTAFANAQTLDEVLQNYYDAIGMSNLNEVQSMKVVGKMVMPAQGIEIPLTTYTERPDKLRVEGEFQGMKFVQVYSDGEGYMTNPFMGITDPQPLDEDQLNEIKEQADMDGPLYNYDAKGHKVELLGTEEMDGVEVFVVKLERESGGTTKYFIDKENYIVLKTEDKVTRQGTEVETESYMSNYMEVDGIVVPFEVEMQVEGNTVLRYVFEEYVLDTELSDTLFAVPDDMGVEPEDLK